jgi:hypothetical protein
MHGSEFASAELQRKSRENCGVNQRTLDARRRKVGAEGVKWVTRRKDSSLREQAGDPQTRRFASGEPVGRPDAERTYIINVLVLR